MLGAQLKQHEILRRKMQQKHYVLLRAESGAALQPSRVRHRDRRDLADRGRLRGRPDRRRIAVWVGLSAAGFLVVFRAVVRISGRRVVGQIVIPVNREAAQVVVSRVLASYLDVTLIALLIGLVVAIIAFMAGPGSVRGRIRNWFADSRSARARRGVPDRRAGARIGVPDVREPHVREVLPRRVDRGGAGVRALEDPQHGSGGRDRRYVGPELGERTMRLVPPQSQLPLPGVPPPPPRAVVVVKNEVDQRLEDLSKLGELKVRA